MTLLMDAAVNDGWLSNEFRNSEAAIKLRYFGFLKLESRYQSKEIAEKEEKIWISMQQAIQERNIENMRELVFQLEDIRRMAQCKSFRLTDAGISMLQSVSEKKETSSKGVRHGKETNSPSCT